MKITNYKLKNFIKKNPDLINKYIVALKYLAPVKTKNEVFHLTLNEVEVVKQNLYSGNNEKLIEIVSFVQGIEPKEVFELNIINFYKIVNSIKEQMTIIFNAESQLAPSEMNLRWEMVEGSEKMAKFGILNTLERLNGGDILKDEAILKLKYSKVFGTLLKRAQQSDLDSQMSKIKLKNE